MRWLDPLVKKADPDDGAAVTDRMAEAYDASSRGDYARALDIWGPLAHGGVARAQNNIGACFSEGLGVERDAKLALQWLSLSAAAGDRLGQRNCAALYFKGEGVAQDYARALELYRAAAEQGDAPAQDMLSWMLLEGEVAEPDYVAARKFAELAAAQGVAASMTRLGMIFHNALGVERDPAKAVLWWRRGAERGDADGQAMLGAAFPGTGRVRRCPPLPIPQRNVEALGHPTKVTGGSPGGTRPGWPGRAMTAPGGIVCSGASAGPAGACCSLQQAESQVT